MTPAQAHVYAADLARRLATGPGVWGGVDVSGLEAARADVVRLMAVGGGVAVERLVPARDGLDALAHRGEGLEGCGVGVVVWVGGEETRRRLRAVLERAAAHPRVLALVLATKAAFAVPAELGGKPLQRALIGRRG